MAKFFRKIGDVFEWCEMQAEKVSLARVGVALCKFAGLLLLCLVTLGAFFKSMFPRQSRTFLGGVRKEMERYKADCDGWVMENNEWLRNVIAGAIIVLLLYIAIAAVAYWWTERSEMAAVQSSIGEAILTDEPLARYKRIRVIEDRMIMTYDIEGVYVDVELSVGDFSGFTSIVKAFQQQEDTPIKEMALVGSRFLQLPRLPPGHVLFLVDDKIIGMGFRCFGNGLVTAGHVARASDGNPEAMQIGVPSETSDKVKTYPVSGLTRVMESDENTDVAMYSVPPKVWAILGISNLRVDHPVTGQAVTLSGVSLKTPRQSRGIVLARKSVFVFRHGCSSTPGWSGAPVVNKENKVVGVHTGHDHEKNLATSMSMFLTPSSVERIKRSGVTTTKEADNDWGSSSTSTVDRKTRLDVERHPDDVVGAVDSRATCKWFVEQSGLVFRGMKSGQYEVKEHKLQGESWADYEDDEESDQGGQDDGGDPFQKSLGTRIKPFPFKSLPNRVNESNPAVEAEPKEALKAASPAPKVVLKKEMGSPNLNSDDTSSPLQLSTQVDSTPAELAKGPNLSGQSPQSKKPKPKRLRSRKGKSSKTSLGPLPGETTS